MTVKIKVADHGPYLFEGAPEIVDGQDDRFDEGHEVQPPTSGRRVATRGERRAMFDGPFLESKEVIGGLFFVLFAKAAAAEARVLAPLLSPTTPTPRRSRSFRGRGL